MNEEETTLKRCQRCTQEFTTEIVLLPSGIRWEDWEESYCEICKPIVEEENRKAHALAEKEKVRVGVEQFVQRICPPRYYETDIERPEFNKGLWEHVEEWRPTPEKPWLALIGPSGNCKTRIAWLKARQLVHEATARTAMERQFSDGVPEKSLVAVTDCELRHAAYSRFGGDEAKAGAERLLRSIRHACILIYDDIGKVKMTDAVCAEMFNIIEHRSANNLPMLWTSNTMPASFCKNLDPSFSEPLRGRLLECSRIIAIE